MSKFKSDKVLPRYFFIAVVLALISIAVIAKAMYIMTVKKDYWEKVAARLVQENDTVSAVRGNILSCDGQLMASSIPQYIVYMDFQPGNNQDTAWARKLDSLWTEKIDSLCEGLHNIFRQRSAEEFKENLLEGRNKMVRNKKTGEMTKGARYWPIWKKRINYNTFLEVKKLPLLNLPPNKGGFSWEEFNTRRHPFGSLALRTIGDIGSEKTRNARGRIITKDSARYGLELACDTLLRGTPGIIHRQKVLNKRLGLVVAPPENGADIVTTIDVNMQDLVERAVIDELKKINGDMGVAILMEVKTGDVKAIANIERATDLQGNTHYMELYNRAVSYRCEPGSVFKVASFLVALDDGVVDTSYVIHTGGGQMMMHGRNMKDHNWRKGGYGDMNVAHALEVSSNIGVSYVIDRFYGQHPEKYVKGLYRVGIHEDLKLPIKGYLPPYIRMPDTKTTDRAKYWSKTTLPWMSIGYETQIAPINTVAFYNAIANNGKMMRPRIVKEIRRDGKVVEELKPQVMIDRIAKEDALNKMRAMLEKVVSKTGTGKNAMSEHFKVAGKTGTAQIAGGGGYRKGVMRYLLSFCGYFPADNPRYTCIVCIQKNYGGSGGVVSGKVFHNIAEGIMAQDVVMKKKSANELKSPGRLVPDVKRGNLRATDIVLTNLGFTTSGQWQQTPATNPPVMGTATYSNKAYNLQKSAQYQRTMMPNVVGMGARDALYLLEQRGLKVKLEGRGRVIEQSVPAGDKVKRKQTVTLRMG